MAKNTVSRVTAYKLKINSFNDFELDNYDLVADATATLEGVRYAYRLFFMRTKKEDVKWYKVFKPILSNTLDKKIPQATVNGFVLTVKINNSFYVVCGGVSHAHLTKAYDVEPRFGIEVAQAVLSMPEIKGLAQKDTSGIVNSLDRIFRGSYNPQGDVENLRRVLTHVRGSLDKRNELLDKIGSSLLAGDALSVNGSKNFSDMLKFLGNVDDLWQKGERKISIPQLKHINKKYESALLDSLEDALVKTLYKHSDAEINNLFLDNMDIGYLPDRVQSYVLHYKDDSFTSDNYEGVFSNIHSILKNIDTPSERIQTFRNLSLKVVFDDGHYEEREIFYYICGDIELNNEVYFITNKQWYCANDEFLRSLNEELDNVEFIPPEDLGLIEWDEQKFTGHGAEKKYNLANGEFVVLDCHLVRIEGERGGIEFCDLLKINGGAFLIHVKNACGAALRALFAQGYVSAKLFSDSSEFKNKVLNCDLTGVDNAYKSVAKPMLERLKGKHKREIKVVFAIYDNTVSHQVGENETQTTSFLKGTLTTFAKIDLMNRVNEIRRMGMHVAVTRIKPYPKTVKK